MEKNFGANEELLKGYQSEVVVGEIQKDDEDIFATAQKEVFKKLLEVNILIKTLNFDLAQTKTQEDMCISSIANSEKALQNINKIENGEIFMHLFNQLQRNFGMYFSAILGMVSGSFADDRIYKDDKQLTKYKKEHSSE